MASDALSQVIARAVIDTEFRDALAKDPEHTLKIAGHKLATSDLATLKGLKPHEWKNLTLHDINARIGQVASWKVSTIES
jgi:hypothetical protein